MLVAVLLLPATAFAAGNRVVSYDVRNVSGSNGQRGVLVAAELAPSVALPAEVSLAVPKGSQVTWVGELLGGDPSLDPTAKYTTGSGPDYDIITMTLTKSRRGQAEVTVPSPASGAAGTRLDLAFTPLEPADTAQLAIEVPNRAQVSAVTGDAKPTQAGGSTFYLRQFTTVTKGAPLAVSVTFTGGTAGSGAAGGQQVPQQAPQQSPVAQGGAQPASPLLVVAVLAVILVGTFLLLERVRPSERAADHSEPPSGHAGKNPATGSHTTTRSRKPASG